MMSFFIHSDSPCNGTGRRCSGLRLAKAHVPSEPAAEAKALLTVGGAPRRTGLTAPEGDYKFERMLRCFAIGGS